MGGRRREHGAYAQILERLAARLPTPPGTPAPTVTDVVPPWCWCWASRAASALVVLGRCLTAGPVLLAVPLRRGKRMRVAEAEPAPA